MLELIFGFLVLILIAIFFLVMFRYLDEQVRRDYQSLYNAENPNQDCMSGCRNGVCTTPIGSPQSNSDCRFDFQCQGCRRPEDDTLFSEIYEGIKRDYRRYRNREETIRLNNRIFQENLDIRKINQAILSGSI